jgi:hypothetical protein
MATRVSFTTPGPVSIEVDDGAQSNSPAEHVIVGVDIGYTCTGKRSYIVVFLLILIMIVAGVALFSINGTPNDHIKPYCIQQWPGMDAPGARTYNKVPTLITYNKAGDFRAGPWGFACPSKKQLLPGMTVKGLFKFFLDPMCLEEFNNGKPEDDQESVENVKKWFIDFLTKLHDHIVFHLKGPMWGVEWGLTKVEYHFSLPTSWEKDGFLVEEFREVVEDAGFGSYERTTIDVGMTEAAASAVYTTKIRDLKLKVFDLALANFHQANPKLRRETWYLYAMRGEELQFVLLYSELCWNLTQAGYLRQFKRRVCERTYLSSI